jgi:hypothetical protein
LDPKELEPRVPNRSILREMRSGREEKRGEGQTEQKTKALRKPWRLRMK